MSSIMRRRSGLMGIVVLIGVLLVSRWRLDSSTLKTGTSHPVTAPWCSHHSPAMCRPTFPACHRLAPGAFVL